ncbi:hypothetical protein E0H35_05300 [Rhizobium leguminosarum bv. viciae]|uniref:Uncharacterized protein n=1 Tax=Rhizobium leguminosarum bv. viciae TaxID=387 RepID=A0A8G2MRF8_RHILV
MQILIARRLTAPIYDSYIALRYHLLQCRKSVLCNCTAASHFADLQIEMIRRPAGDQDGQELQMSPTHSPTRPAYAPAATLMGHSPGN